KKIFKKNKKSLLFPVDEPPKKKGPDCFIQLVPKKRHIFLFESVRQKQASSLLLYTLRAMIQFRFPENHQISVSQFLFLLRLMKQLCIQKINLSMYKVSAPCLLNGQQKSAAFERKR